MTNHDPAPDMVERVRNAILKARFYDYEPHMYESLEAFIEQIDEEHKFDAEGEARAAIEAMRKPTEAMMWAALCRSGMEDWDHIDSRLEAAWQASIDAALQRERG
jgi:hypothetical protein